MVMWLFIETRGDAYSIHGESRAWCMWLLGAVVGGRTDVVCGSGSPWFGVSEVWI